MPWLSLIPGLVYALSPGRWLIHGTISPRHLLWAQALGRWLGTAMPRGCRVTVCRGFPLGMLACSPAAPASPACPGQTSLVPSDGSKWGAPEPSLDLLPPLAGAEQRLLCCQAEESAHCQDTAKGSSVWDSARSCQDKSYQVLVSRKQVIPSAPRFQGLAHSTSLLRPHGHSHNRFPQPVVSAPAGERNRDSRDSAPKLESGQDSVFTPQAWGVGARFQTRSAPGVWGRLRRGRAHPPPGSRQPGL